jgi:hypothetical protein
MYWPYLFRDHYFRMATSAYVLQFDLMTALSQLQDDLSSWRKYLATAVNWNVEFSFLRHGPMWFAIADEGCTHLNDSAERIEYHDAFPDEFMARLRRLYGAMETPDLDEFEQRLARADLRDFTLDNAENWLRLCHCALESPDPGCEVQLVRLGLTLWTAQRSWGKTCTSFGTALMPLVCRDQFKGRRGGSMSICRGGDWHWRDWRELRSGILGSGCYKLT